MAGRVRQIIALGALLLIAAGLADVPGPAAAAVAATPDDDLRAEQAGLESGAGLSGRAQRVLFQARLRQDEGDQAAAAALLAEWLDGDAGRDHHLLRFTLATARLAQGETAAARADLERAVALAPRYGRAWLRLGEAAYELEDYGRAAEAFARAYDLSPGHEPELLHYAGAALLAADRPAEAVTTLVRLVESHPDAVPPAWIRALAAAAVAAGQPDRARPHLEALLHARPDDPEVWDLAYRFHAGLAEYDQAVVHLAVLDHLRGLDADGLVQLGDLYAAVGVPLQAARTYERAFANAEPSPADFRKLASAWLAAHRPDAAGVTLDRALAARPTARLWALRGDVAYEAGAWAAADSAYAAALDLDPDLGRAHLMRGYCAYEQDDPAAARAHLQRAEVFPDQAALARRTLERLGAP